MAYARDAKPIVSPCGNDSFLRRNDLNDLRAAVRNRSFLTGRILSLSCSCAWSERVAQRRRFPLALLHRVPDHGRLANGGQKKLRESAATSLKRFVARKLARRPVRPVGGRGTCRGDSSTKGSHRVQFRTLVSSLRCCRIRPDYGRILATCFQRSRVPLGDGGPCRQSPRVTARVLITWHKILNNIV